MNSIPSSVSSSGVQKLSPSDWLVLWLSLGNSNQVKGKTILMKQIFVVGKEVVPQAFPSLGFYAHRFGPYSRVLDNALNDLQMRSLIQVTEQVEAEGSLTTDVKRYDYLLTGNGQMKARELLPRIPDDVVQALIRYRRLLSRMGYYGLLNYVYRTYPEFTTMSELEFA